MSEDEQWLEIRKALAHQQSLQQSIGELLHQVNPGFSQRRTALSDKLQHAATDLSGLEQYFSKFVKPIFYNERASTEGDVCLPAVRKVFDLPELVEMIMQYLSIEDILNFQRVDRIARDIINNSPHLQRSLSLRPDPQDGPIRLPFDSQNFRSSFGFVTDQAYRRGRRCFTGAGGSQLPLSIRFCRPARGLYPTIGTRWRQMYIVQPPIKEIRVHRPCCDQARHRDDRLTLTAETGITIGDLYDMASKLSAEHRFCPFATPFLHDDDGIVRVDISFSVTITLRPDDAMALAQKTVQIDQSHHNDQTRARNDRMTVYGNYKKSGMLHPSPSSRQQTNTNISHSPQAWTGDSLAQ